MCYHIGLEALALRELRRALEIDPSGRITKAVYQDGMFLLGRSDEVMDVSVPEIVIGPRALALMWKGRLDEAEASLREHLAADSGNPYALGMQALLLARRGKFAEAESGLAEIAAKAGDSKAAHHVSYAIASVYALDGRARDAVTWLRKTAETGMPDYPLFVRDPHLDRIRSDPGFLAFMAELKPRWEAYRKEFE